MKLLVQFDIQGVPPGSVDPQDFAAELTDPFGPVRRDIAVSVETARWEEANWEDEGG